MPSSSSAPSQPASKLTEAQRELVIRAYQQGSGSDQVAEIMPLATLGVDSPQLVVGDDTYALDDCFAVSPTPAALVEGDGVDRSDVHVVYLDPQEMNAGYLGGYADVIP